MSTPNWRKAVSLQLCIRSVALYPFQPLACCGAGHASAVTAELAAAALAPTPAMDTSSYSTIDRL